MPWLNRHKSIPLVAMNRSRLYKVAGLLLVLVLQLVHHVIPHLHPNTPTSIAHSVGDSHHHHIDGAVHDHHHHHDHDQPNSEDKGNYEQVGDWLASILIVHTHSTHSHEAFLRLSSLQLDDKIKNSLAQGNFLAYTGQIVHPEKAAGLSVFAIPPLPFRVTSYFSSRSLRAPPVLG